MAKVHPTAVLLGDVQLADDVQVGPYCVLDGTLGPVEIGPGCVLVSAAHLSGPLRMGAGNIVYPNVCLGFAPQDVGFDPHHAGPGVVIGQGNRFREGFTLHRAKWDQPTRIGDHNFFMTNTHVGHDAVVCNHCVIASGSLLAGHVLLEDRVTMGGNAYLHQFCRVGKGCMFSGGTGASLDVPPWFTVTAPNVVGSINLVGMRRNGMNNQQIQSVKWIFKTMYRSGITPQQALPTLETRADDPTIAEYLAFIKSSKRGICHGAGRATRGQGGGGMVHHIAGARVVPDAHVPSTASQDDAS